MLRRRNRSSRRCAMVSNDNERTRAAASSIARGMPSSRVHTSVSTVASRSVMSRLERCAAARSTNSCTDAQRLPAGSKYLCALSAAKEVAGQRRACIDQMLAIIQYQQHPPMFKVVEDGFGDGLTNVLSQAEYASHSVYHEGRIW